MRLSFAPRKKNAGRPANKSAPGFLQWLRGRPCILAHTGECEGRMEAMHVDHGGDKGMSTKVSDRFAIPGCSGHHREQHNSGWATFQAKHKFDALWAAGQYWSKWPGRGAWEARNG